MVSLCIIQGLRREQKMVMVHEMEATMLTHCPQQIHCTGDGNPLSATCLSTSPAPPDIWLGPPNVSPTDSGYDTSSVYHSSNTAALLMNWVLQLSTLNLALSYDREKAAGMEMPEKVE